MRRVPGALRHGPMPAMQGARAGARSREAAVMAQTIEERRRVARECQMRRYHRLADAGRCRQCGTRPATRGVCCADCAARRAARTRERYRRDPKARQRANAERLDHRVRDGLCVRCAVPVYGSRCCPGCAALDRAHHGGDPAVRPLTAGQVEGLTMRARDRSETVTVRVRCALAVEPDATPHRVASLTEIPVAHVRRVLATIRRGET